VPVLPGCLARRYTLLSACMAAVSVGLVTDLLRTRLARGGLSARAGGLLAFLGGLTWGLGPALWSQAVITEVYALQACFTALLVWRAAALSNTPSAGAWVALGLAAGLGLGSHLTVALILPGIALWAWPKGPARQAAPALVGLALGLSSFLYIPLAAQKDPPVLWGDPRTLEGFWWLVSGRLYRGYAFRAPGSLLMARVADLARRLVQQYTLPGVAFLMLGLQTGTRLLTRRQLFSSVLIAILPVIYALGYNTPDSYVYLLPAFLMGSLWLTLGVAAAWQAWEPRPNLRRLLLAGLAGVVIWLGVVNVHWQDLRADAEAEEWLADVLAQAPQGALLITETDAHTFALEYARWALGLREDLTLVNASLWSYPWYRKQVAVRDPDALLPDASLEELVESRLALQPVYLTDEHPGLAVRFPLRQEGVLWRVDGPAQ